MPIINFSIIPIDFTFAIETIDIMAERQLLTIDEHNLTPNCHMVKFITELATELGNSGVPGAHDWHLFKESRPLNDGTLTYAFASPICLDNEYMIDGFERVIVDVKVVSPYDYGEEKESSDEEMDYTDTDTDEDEDVEEEKESVKKECHGRYPEYVACAGTGGTGGTKKTAQESVRKELLKSYDSTNDGFRSGDGHWVDDDRYD